MIGQINVTRIYSALFCHTDEYNLWSAIKLNIFRRILFSGQDPEKARQLKHILFYSFDLTIIIIEQSWYKNVKKWNAISYIC